MPGLPHLRLKLFPISSCSNWQRSLHSGPEMYCPMGIMGIQSILYSVEDGKFYTCPRGLHTPPSFHSQHSSGLASRSSSLAVPTPLPNKLHTIKSERWSDPELKPLVSESEGLLERESKMGRVSRRDRLTEGAGNLSTKSDPRGSRGRKLKGGFPRTLPSGLWSMLSTRKRGEKKENLMTS